MMNISKRGSAAVLLLLFILIAIAIAAACGNEMNKPAASNIGHEEPEDIVNTPTGSAAEPSPSEPADVLPDKSETTDKHGETGADQAEEVVAEPEAIAVLVNKTYALPKDYEPADLTEPDIPFIFSEKGAKRMMRKEAAEALEKLFAGAEKDGIGLKGVSGYRSYATQKALFERYAIRDGEAAASRYSARPGHSEHSTGLAMDVTGRDGKCAAEDCFGGTEEAEWLAGHAHEYGFIIRYPEGKEEITGYKYEPWHLRYVGLEIAGIIADKGITLEEYYETEA